jgi:predicted aldo/keto reductase-like oxidoreductase
MGEKALTRRQFLKNIGIACACSNLLINPVAPRAALAKSQQKERVKEVLNMKFRVLGKTGLKVSIVSFGVMRLTEPSVLFKALEMGVNYFDTAHKYQGGNNEKMLGAVLKDYGRDNIFVATKIPPYHKQLGNLQLQSATKMEKMLDKSLRRLQTDHVDVLFLHNIKDPAWPVNEDMIAFLEKSKRAGKARFVGISFHVGDRNYVDIVNEALKVDFYDVFLATFNFKSPPEHIEALRRARNKNVGIVAMKTQAGGYKGVVRGALSPHQAALMWALNHDFVDCAIPGMVNREELMENTGVVGKKLSWSGRKILHTYYETVKDRYCLRCRACFSSCTKGIHIPTIHRCLMYWEGYGDFDLARETYQALTAGENAQACLSCSVPACRCINGIKVAERMRHAHTAFA